MTRKKTISDYPVLSLDEISRLIRQKKPHGDFSSKIIPYNNDAEWKDRIRDCFWAREYAGTHEDPRYEKILKLRDMLLSIGGCEACMPTKEEDYDNIVRYGQLWDDIIRVSMKGRPSKCHSNSSELWYANQSSYKRGHAIILCTGYALSEDGFWRQHSWLVHAKARANNIVETTEPRIAYFGFGMSYNMADEFAYKNT